MRIRPLILAAALSGALAAPAAARASDSAAGQAAIADQVVVSYDATADEAQKVSAQESTDTTPVGTLADGAQVLKIKGGRSVSSTIGELRKKPGVRYAVPNFRMHAAARASTSEQLADIRFAVLPRYTPVPFFPAPGRSSFRPSQCWRGNSVFLPAAQRRS